SCAADETWAFGPGRARPKAAWIAARLSAIRRARTPRALTSIIIPCVDGLRWTRECIAAVKRHTKTPYEIILVDNASSDGTGAWARRAGARVIRNKTNLGFAKAINQGMAAARGRWFVWLNNDVVVTPGWLERLIDCAERAPWIAAVGPCTDVTVGFQRVSAPPFKNERDLLMFSEAWAMRHAGQAEGVHRLTGFCVLVKREAVRLVGVLDERFGLGTYEEFDYCLRLRQAGYDLAVARDVFVRHHGHKSFGSFTAMASLARRNRELFLDKWCRQALSFLDDVNPTAAGAA
ncbi:MAG: glycosyltransferase family 2 protein, partial [Elusimicrobiota bacterium]